MTVLLLRGGPNTKLFFGGILVKYEYNNNGRRSAYGLEILFTNYALLSED